MQERPEGRLLQPSFGRANQAQVVDHEVRWQPGKPGLQLDQMMWSQQKLEVPPHVLDPGGEAFESIQRQAARMREDEADAAHPVRMQARKLLVRRVGRNDHNDARREAELGGRFQLAAIVAAVHARLDEHRPCDAQRVEEMATDRREGVRRRVLPSATSG